MLAVLARATRSASVSWNPLDSRWYQDIGSGRSSAGITVLPEDALRLAVVYRAINVRAHAVASVPLVIYRNVDDEGKEKARTHPQYALLHDRPNAYQTSFRWRHLAMVQKILMGNHYSELLPGRGGVGQLAPLPPATTRVVDQLADGRLLYVTKPVYANGRMGVERRLTQDDVLHLRGLSLDGRSGLPLNNVARNAMGLALAAERHGAMFLRKGARFAGVLSTDGKMDPEARKENESAWQRSFGGAEGSGGTPILSGGMKYTPITSSNKDSQWLETRTHQVEELLRYIGVPGVLCGYADKTSTYASAEQFFLSFVTYTVQMDTEDFAQELNSTVVTGSPEYFASFILEGLLRGDIKTRYEAYRSAITTGWMSRNEARRTENMNAGPTELDEFLEPLNMVDAEGDRSDERGRGRDADRDDDDDDEDDVEDSDSSNARVRRFEAIAHAAIDYLVTLEVTAVAGGGAGKKGAAARFAADPERWEAWLESFYVEQGARVADFLHVSAERATRYAASQVEQLLAGIPDNFHNLSVAAMTALLED